MGGLLYGCRNLACLVHLWLLSVSNPAVIQFTFASFPGDARHRGGKWNGSYRTWSLRMLSVSENDNRHGAGEYTVFAKKH